MMSDKPIIVSPTVSYDKTLGKVESDINYLRNEMHEIKADLKNQASELRKLNAFLDQARGAKSAVVGMWLIAGTVGAAIWSVAERAFQFVGKH